MKKTKITTALKNIKFFRAINPEIEISAYKLNLWILHEENPEDLITIVIEETETKPFIPRY